MNKFEDLLIAINSYLGFQLFNPDKILAIIVLFLQFLLLFVKLLTFLFSKRKNIKVSIKSLLKDVDNLEKLIYNIGEKDGYKN